MSEDLDTASTDENEDPNEDKNYCIKTTFDFSSTHKKGVSLLHGCYRYVKNSINRKRNIQYWACDRRGCKSRAKTSIDDYSYGNVNMIEHNHLADPKKILLQQTLDDLSSIAATSSKSPKNLTRDLKFSAELEILARLPFDSSLSHRVYTAREHVIPMAHPEMRSDIAEHIHIPAELCVTSKGSRFLLHDFVRIINGETHRLLVFVTPESLFYLQKYRNWSSDGTFRICPKQFKQYYVLGIVINHHVIPVVHALITGKHTILYQQFFQSIKAILPTEFQPASLLCDFEFAAIKAFLSVFSSAVIYGCLFHLCNAFTKKLSRLGLKRSLENPDVYLVFRKCIALTLLPRELVVLGFRLIVITSPVEFSAFFPYLAKTYIGRSRNEKINRDTFYDNICGIGMDNLNAEAVQWLDDHVEYEPLISTDIWNIRTRLETELPTCNNALEVFHKHFMAAHNRIRPPVDKFLRSILEEAENRDIQLKQFTVKPVNGRKKRRTRVNEEQVKKIVSTHQLDSNDSVLRFLEAIAFHFMGFDDFDEVPGPDDEEPLDLNIPNQ